MRPLKGLIHEGLIRPGEGQAAGIEDQLILPGFWIKSANFFPVFFFIIRDIGITIPAINPVNALRAAFSHQAPGRKKGIFYIFVRNLILGAAYGKSCRQNKKDDQTRAGASKQLHTSSS